MLSLLFRFHLCATLGIAILATSSSLAQDTVTVRKVMDGRTFITTDGQHITLLGVDLPREKQAIDADDTKRQLEKTIGGQQVILVTDTSFVILPTEDKPRPRYVYHNGQLVNHFFVYYGYGNAVTSSDYMMRDEFRKAEAAARVKQMGVWAKERSAAVQCSAKTHKGTQCERMTTNLSGECWQHE